MIKKKILWKFPKQQPVKLKPDSFEARRVLVPTVTNYVPPSKCKWEQLWWPSVFIIFRPSQLYYCIYRYMEMLHGENKYNSHRFEILDFTLQNLGMEGLNTTEVYNTEKVKG